MVNTLFKLHYFIYCGWQAAKRNVLDNVPTVGCTALECTGDDCCKDSTTTTTATTLTETTAQTYASAEITIDGNGTTVN